MHRSGTSAIARGLAALSVYLGDDLYGAHPENPTGYWEDKRIVDINERLLKALGLKWDDSTLIERRQFAQRRVRLLQRDAVRYVNSAFNSAPLWGFKDPRTIRVLPFWRDVLCDSDVHDSYVVAIRNPRSVAASLFVRQAMDVDEAYRLWLAHMVPFLDQLRGKPFVVVDYDLLMRDARAQLERIGDRLGILKGAGAVEIDRFAADFLNANLRHSVFTTDGFDDGSEIAAVTKDAYLRLYDLATDRLDGHAPSFWIGWANLQGRLEAVLPPRPPPRRPWLFRRFGIMLEKKPESNQGH
jgi:hypothetical protein